MAVYYSINNEVQWPNQLVEVVQIVLYWLLIRWLIANLASNGQPLGLELLRLGLGLSGMEYSVRPFPPHHHRLGLGDAAQARWLCRNIQGTRRQVVFKGTGLENLWRAIVFFICCAFIIPIPWMYRWMMRWQLSQTEFVERV